MCIRDRSKSHFHICRKLRGRLVPVLTLSLFLSLYLSLSLSLSLVDLSLIHIYPDGIKVIPLGRDGDAVGEGLMGRRQVQKGQLETDGAVKIVEEIAPDVYKRQVPILDQRVAVLIFFVRFIEFSGMLIPFPLPGRCV